MIELLPGPFGSELTLNLWVVDIILHEGVVDHNRQLRITYEAISYCWGAPIFGHHVTVNELPYPITQSLYLGLQNIRFPDRSHYVWVDALCINQHNLDERAMQVSNMRDIFQKARRVLVWLGDCSSDTAFALDSCGDLGNEGFAQNAEFDKMSIQICISHSTGLLYGLVHMFNRSWYQRIWIRQEVWSARDALVCCGLRSLTWSELKWLYNLANSLLKRLDPRYKLDRSSYRPLDEQRKWGFDVFKTENRLHAPASRTLEHLGFLGTISEGLEGPGSSCDCGNAPSGMPLLESLRRTAHCEYTDRRDRIYGILGMTDANPKPRNVGTRMLYSLTIDYGRSTAEVFQDTTRYIMLSDCNIDLLFLDGKFGGEVDGQSIPSWCLNWALPFKNDPLDDLVWTEGNFYFENRSLCIDGCEVATVISTSPLQVLPPIAMAMKEEFASTICLRVESWDWMTLEYQATGNPSCENIVVSTSPYRYLLILRPLPAGHFSFIGRINALGFESVPKEDGTMYPSFFHLSSRCFKIV